MILADKIIKERKKNGWSQEELADQLDVSRQSVSKWESGQSIPDLDKIIKLASIFSVSTDYLLRDDLEDTSEVRVEESFVEDSKKRKVSLKEALEYLDIVKKNSRLLALATALCILSPVCLIVLNVLNGEGTYLSSTLSVLIGLVTLFILIAIAVGLFMYVDYKERDFKFLKKEAFETEYGVTGIVKEKKKAYEPTYIKFTIIATILCIFSVVPLFFVIVLETTTYIAIAISLLLLFVIIGVSMFIVVNCIKGSFDVLLEENEYSKKQKEKNHIMDTINSIYWISIVAIYLGISFIFDNWSISWIVWPIAALIYVVIMNIVDLVNQKRK